ncbi:MAG: hypothetical protein ABIO79_13340 [Ferruginibacter sp.]
MPLVFSVFFKPYPASAAINNPNPPSTGQSIARVLCHGKKRENNYQQQHYHFTQTGIDFTFQFFKKLFSKKLF